MPTPDELLRPPVDVQPMTAAQVVGLDPKPAPLVAPEPIVRSEIIPKLPHRRLEGMGEAAEDIFDNLSRYFPFARHFENIEKARLAQADRDVIGGTQMVLDLGGTLDDVPWLKAKREAALARENERQWRAIDEAYTDYTVPATVMRGVADMMPWMAEFGVALYTGGAAAGVLGIGGPGLAGAVGKVAVATALAPVTTQLPSTLARFETEKAGNYIITRDGQAIPVPGVGGIKGMIEAWQGETISVFTEQTGGAITTALSPIGRVIGGRIGKLLQITWTRTHPGEAFFSALKRVGYDGIVGELSEEELERVFRALSGLESYPSWKQYGLRERAIEAAVIAVPGIPGHVADITSRLIGRHETLSPLVTPPTPPEVAPPTVEAVTVPAEVPPYVRAKTWTEQQLDERTHLARRDVETTDIEAKISEYGIQRGNEALITDIQTRRTEENLTADQYLEILRQTWTNLQSAPAVGEDVSRVFSVARQLSLFGPSIETIRQVLPNIKGPISVESVTEALRSEAERVGPKWNEETWESVKRVVASAIERHAERVAPVAPPIPPVPEAPPAPAAAPVPPEQAPGLLDIFSAAGKQKILGKPGITKYTKGAEVVYAYRDEDGRLAGALNVTRTPVGKGATRRITQDALVFDIAVTPELQRQGIATKLLKQAETDGLNLQAALPNLALTAQGEKLVAAYFGADKPQAPPAPAVEVVKPAPIAKEPPPKVRIPLPPITPGVGARKAWETTQKTFLGDTKRPTSEVITYHKQVVREALARGLAVPPEVLADYPDLAARYAPKAPPAPTEDVRASRIEFLGNVADEGDQAYSIGAVTTDAFQEIRGAEANAIITRKVAEVLRRGVLLLDKHGIRVKLMIGAPVMVFNPDIAKHREVLLRVFTEGEINEHKEKGGRFLSHASILPHYDSQGKLQWADIEISQHATPVEAAHEIAHAADYGGLLAGWAGVGKAAAEQKADYLAETILTGKEGALPEFARAPTAEPVSARAYAIRRYPQERSEVEDEIELLRRIEEAGVGNTADFEKRVLEAQAQARIKGQGAPELLAELKQAPPRELASRVARLGDKATPEMRDAAKMILFARKAMAAIRAEVKKIPDWRAAKVENEFLSFVREFMTKVSYAADSEYAEPIDSLIQKWPATKTMFKKTKAGGPTSVNEFLEYFRSRGIVEYGGAAEWRFLEQVASALQEESEGKVRDFAQKLRQFAEREHAEMAAFEVPEGEVGYYERQLKSYESVAQDEIAGADKLVAIFTEKLNDAATPHEAILTETLIAHISRLRKIEDELDALTRKQAKAARLKLEAQLRTMYGKEVKRIIREAADAVSISRKRLRQWLLQQGLPEEPATAAELKPVYDRVKEIAEAKRLADEMYVRTKTEIVSRIHSAGRELQTDSTGAIIPPKENWFTKAIVKMNLNLEHLIYELDGQTPRIVNGEIVGGPLFEHVWKPLWSSLNEQYRLESLFRWKLLARLDELGVDAATRRLLTAEARGNTAIISVQTRSGKEFAFTPGQLAAFIMTSRDSKGYEDLQRPGGFFLRQIERRDQWRMFAAPRQWLAQHEGRLTPDDIADIQATATPNVQKLMQALREFYDGPIFDIINEIYRRQNGVDRLPDEMRGTYYSLIHHRDYIHKDDPAPKFMGFGQRTIENPYFLKAREPATSPLVIGDAIDNFGRYLKLASAYVAWTESLHNARAYLDSADINAAIREGFGQDYLDRLHEMMHRVEGQLGRPDYIEKTFALVRRRLTMTRLLMDPRSYLKQIGSWFEVHSYTPEGSLEATVNALTPSVSAEADAFVRQYNPYLHSRFESTSIDRDAAISHDDPETWFAGGKSPGQSLWARFGWFDRQGIRSAIVAIRRAYPDLSAWKQAELIDFAVRNSQPGWDTILRGYLTGSPSELTKTLTMFSSWKEMKIRMVTSIVRDWRQAKRSGDDALLADTQKRAALWIAGLWAPTALIGVLTIGAGYLVGEDEEERKRTIVNRAYAMLIDTMGLPPLWGSSVATGLFYTVVRRYPGATYVNPIMNAMGDMGVGLWHAPRAILATLDGEVMQSGPHKGESKGLVYFMRFVDKAVLRSAVPVFTGIPEVGLAATVAAWIYKLYNEGGMPDTWENVPARMSPPLYRTRTPERGRARQPAGR